MKQKVLAILIILTLMLCCTRCSYTSYQEATATDRGNVQADAYDFDFGNGYFITIAKWDDRYCTYKIVYAKDTKVKYFVFTETHRSGISPLYNADGTLQIYSNED